MSKKIIPILVLLLGAALLPVLALTGREGDASAWLMLLPLPAAAGLCLVFWKRRPEQHPVYSASRMTVPISLLGLAVVSVFTAWHGDFWYIFLQWWPVDASLYDRFLFRFVLLACLLTPLFLLPAQRVWVLLFAGLLMCQYFSFQNLLEGAAGQPLYRTDHPSFMFRLYEFAACFPSLVNYNPYWNAGSQHY